MRRVLTSACTTFYGTHSLPFESMMRPMHRITSCTLTTQQGLQQEPNVGPICFTLRLRVRILASSSSPSWSCCWSAVQPSMRRRGCSSGTRQSGHRLVTSKKITSPMPVCGKWCQILRYRCGSRTVQYRLYLIPHCATGIRADVCQARANELLFRGTITQIHVCPRQNISCCACLLV